MGRNLKRGRLKKFWDRETNWHFVLCTRNFENSSSAAELLEKIMIVAHVMGKSENLRTKIDKLELDSEWEPFFREHLKLATKIDKSQFDSE